MKLNKILFGIALLTIFLSSGYVLASRLDSSLVAKPKSGDSLTNGLVGWWTMDGADVTTNTTTDKSGSGNNGTRTAVTPVAGKIGQAMKFNGTTSKIDMGDPSSGNLDFGTNDFSVSVWVKRSASSNYQAMIGKGDCITFALPCWEISQYGANNTISFRIRDASHGLFSEVSNPDDFFDNKWIHIVGVRDNLGGSDRIYLYINGKRKIGQIESVAADINVSNANNLLIGNIATSFHGTIDDVRIYNRVLSTAEITALYKYGQTKIGSSQTAKPTAGDTLKNGLVGWWTMDGADTSGGTIIDKGSGGHNGSKNGNPIGGAGRIGQAMKFNGIDDRVNVIYTGGQNYPMSLSFWSKEGAASGSKIAVALNGGTFPFVEFVQSPYRLLYYGSTNGYLYSNTIPNATAWHYVVVTAASTTANSVNIYIDGALSNSISVVATEPMSVIGSSILIGNVLNGLMDDVRLYNRVLSASEVKALYKYGQEKIGSSLQNEPASGNSLKSGLVGWWTMDGQDVKNTTILDKSGFGTSLTRSGPTLFFAPGKIGQGNLLKAGISTASINATPNNAMIIGNTGTISVWIKLSSLNLPNSTHYILAYSSADTNLGYALNQYGTDLLIYWIGGGPKVTLTNVFTTNKWYHLALTNQNGALTAYVNGVSRGTGTSGGAVTTTQPFSIGYSLTNPSGIIDDARIYNRALSASEVLSLYNQGSNH